ncbi:MAG: GNAT family N-acetyltransferase [Chloroflexi bacterium]|nr:GNAT family N-acetyltransferase [Chloroflexota bacterium]
MILEGEHVRLRPATAEDLPAYTRWYTDPDFRYYMGAEGETFDTLLSPRPNGANFSVEENGGRLIGFVFVTGIRTINRHCELGLVAIGEPDARDKGYGTEMLELVLGHCFDGLGMHQVSIRTAEFNERACHTYAKIFPHEMRHRECVWSDDRFWDEVYFDITEEEWAARA